MTRGRCKWCGDLISTTSDPNPYEGRFISKEDIELIESETAMIDKDGIKYFTQFMDAILCPTCDEVTVRNDYYWNTVMQPEYTPPFPRIKLTKEVMPTVKEILKRWGDEVREHISVEEETEEQKGFKGILEAHGFTNVLLLSDGKFCAQRGNFRYCGLNLVDVSPNPIGDIDDESTSMADVSPNKLQITFNFERFERLP